MNKVLQISIWTLLAISIVAVLGFVNKNYEAKKCEDIIVNIDYETENRFVSEDDVKKDIVNDTTDHVLSYFDLLILEGKIKNNSAIKDAQIYKTIDGKIVVDVKQRRPIVRVFTAADSYYIDEKGYLMTTSNKYTSRVLVVSGLKKEPYAKRYQYNYKYLADTLQSKTMLDDVYKIAKYIDESEFWTAQIEQVYVNKDLEMELVPKVGNHKIVFGGVEGLESKFEKLMIFYKKGLSKTGWNEYSEINLKFKDQVVCTKKY